MAKKINLNFILVTAASVLLAVFFTTLISYQLFQKEVFSDLSSFADFVDALELIPQMKESGFETPDNELRITWIAEDGSILYDSYADDASLDNHSSRPEVQEAMRRGNGFCVRRSRTMEENIFFYAKKAQDGTILRVAKEAGSIWNVFRNIFPAVLLIAVLVFLLSIAIAGRLTKAFLKPVEQMADDMDHLENVDAYPELMPFIDRIRSQHTETLQLARLRQEFTANVSHELKTPLTSISGYAELIASGMASKKESRHFAQEIHSNAQRLLCLINDILQLSEMDAPQGQACAFERVDLYALARRCIDRMRPAADKLGVTLSLTGHPLSVHADKDLMEELLCNLCDNAIRYNRPGGQVWITVDEGLEIRDNGIGIPKRYQGRVFERFFRVDKSRSKKTGGTGLGLAIVKHIAELHHASLTLDSDGQQGTTVRIRFPDPAKETQAKSVFP